jgi:hypothetical protein
MTFRGLTELQEQSRNAAHTSAITHSVERMAEARWIAAGDGSWSERDCGRRWMTRWITVRDRSRPDMDRDRIWMDDRRWMTGGG